MTKVPGLKEEGLADDIGKVGAGVLAGGLAVHAIAANISKRKELLSRIARGKTNEQNIDS